MAVLLANLSQKAYNRNCFRKQKTLIEVEVAEDSAMVPKRVVSARGAEITEY